MNKLAKTKTPRAAFGKLLLNETRLAWRVPVGLLAGIGLPLALLIIFGSIPALGKVSKELGGQSYFSLSFPILLSVIVLSLGTVVLPRVLVSYRETGILRRLSITPIPPSWLLAAQIVVNLFFVALGLTILIGVGILAFGLAAPKDLLGFVIALLLTTSSMFAIGLWIAAIARNSGVAQGIGAVLFYALLFFGGIWIPRPLMPHIFLQIGNWIPLGASVDALQTAAQGAFPTIQSLLCLAGCTLVFGYFALRYFRWE